MAIAKIIFEDKPDRVLIRTEFDGGRGEHSPALEMAVMCARALEGVTGAKHLAEMMSARDPKH